MKHLLLAVALILSGCAVSSGVVPMGQNTYLVSNENRSPGGTMGDAQSGALREAAEFCKDKGGDFEVLNRTDVPRAFGQFPATSIQFRCMKKQ